MGCGTACGTKGEGGCGGGCSSGGCNKLNVYDWLADIALPPGMMPYDVVEVNFKGSRKSYFRNVHKLDLYKDDPIVVECETGGYDIGRVSVKGELVKLQMKKNGIQDDDDRILKIYRKATEADLAKWQECKEMEIPTQYKARSIAIELGLEMKLSDVEYQADRRKATFYYTAEGRVDFRELIKRLAGEFRVKIEMRQISYREEAGRLGSIGSCGRVLCCSTWLTDFKQVNNSAARYQNLSLNPLKLSGQCGRLKCCLNYELDAYIEALDEFPKDDRLRIELETGTAVLQKTDILRRIMWFVVLGGDSSGWISLPVSKVKELMEMNARGEKPLQLAELIEETIAEEEPDFKDMVGEESITRLDRPRKKKRKGPGGGNQNPQNRQGGNPNRQPGNNPNQQNRPPRDNNNRNERNNAPNAPAGEKRGPDENRPPRDGNRDNRNRQPRDNNRNNERNSNPPNNSNPEKRGPDENRPPRDGNRNPNNRDNRNQNRPPRDNRNRPPRNNNNRDNNRGGNPQTPPPTDKPNPPKDNAPDA